MWTCSLLRKPSSFQPALVCSTSRIITLPAVGTGSCGSHHASCTGTVLIFPNDIHLEFGHHAAAWPLSPTPWHSIQQKGPLSLLWLAWPAEQPPSSTAWCLYPLPTSTGEYSCGDQDSLWHALSDIHTSQKHTYHYTDIKWMWSLTLNVHLFFFHNLEGIRMLFTDY